MSLQKTMQDKVSKATGIFNIGFHPQKDSVMIILWAMKGSHPLSPPMSRDLKRRCQYMGCTHRTPVVDTGAWLRLSLIIGEPIKKT